MTGVAAVFRFRGSLDPPLVEICGDLVRLTEGLASDLLGLLVP